MLKCTNGVCYFFIIFSSLVLLVVQYYIKTKSTHLNTITLLQAINNRLQQIYFQQLWVPTPFVISVIVIVTCSNQNNVESMLTPKNFTQFHLFIILLLIDTSTFHEKYLSLVWNITHFVWSILRDSLFAFIPSVTLSICVLIFIIISLMSLTLVKLLVSSIKSKKRRE